MRDVVDINSVSRNADFYVGGSNYRYEFDRIYKVRMSHRSESVPTVKQDGKWVLPTQYSAFDARHTPQQYLFHEAPRYDWFFNQWVTRWYSGKLTEGSWFNWPMTYGCSDAFPYVPVVPFSVVQRNRSRLLGKIQSSDFNLGTAAAEADKSLLMIMKRARQFFRAFRAAKRGNFRKVADILEISAKKRRQFGANSWLELQYGWKPLLSDIFKACNAMVEGLDHPKWTVEAKTQDPGFGPIPVPAPLQQITNIRVQGKFTRGITASATFTVPNGFYFNLYQLGVSDPLSIAWELFPFSFVIDWFLHISEFLRHLTLPLVALFLHGYETYWVDSAWTAEEFNPKFFGTQPKQSFVTKSMARVPNLGFPIPLPYIDPLLSGGQVINLLALIAQHKK